MALMKHFLPIVILAITASLYLTNPINDADIPNPTKRGFVKVTDYQIFTVAKAKKSGGVWLGAASQWVRADWAEQPSQQLEHFTRWSERKYRKHLKPTEMKIKKRLELFESIDLVIGANAVVFFLWCFMSTEFMIRHFALQHDSLYRPWTLLTCAFSHQDAFILAIQLSALFNVIPRCEDYVGQRFIFQLLGLLVLANSVALLFWHYIMGTQFWSYTGSLAIVIGMTAAFTRDGDGDSTYYLGSIGPMSGDQLLMAQLLMIAAIFGKKNLVGLVAAAAAGCWLGPYFASRSQFIFYEDAIKWTSDLIGKAGWR